MKKVFFILALMSLCLATGAAWAGQDIDISGVIADNVLGNGTPPDGTAPAVWPDNAEGNSVTINNGGSVAGVVFGGAGIVSVTNNSVTVNSGGSVSSVVAGGFASHPTDKATALGNRVNISGGSVGMDVIGGLAQSVGEAETKGNSVTISGGSVGVMVIGGAAMSDADAAAVDNSITMSGGNALEDIYGGYAGSGAGDVKVTGSIVSMSGGSAKNVGGGRGISNTGDVTITGSKVSISGGTINGNAGGGYIECPAGTATGTGNTLTISGNPVFHATSGLYGSNIDVGTGDEFTGNRLELKTAIVVQLVCNFEFMDFYLPSGISDGDVMLALTDSTSLTDVKVDLKFNTSPPNLAVGDVITLIDWVLMTGSFSDKTVTVSGYTFEISRTSGKLVAEVTAAPGKKGGGGGCNGFTYGLVMLALFVPFVLRGKC